MNLIVAFCGLVALVPLHFVHREFRRHLEFSGAHHRLEQFKVSGDAQSRILEVQRHEASARDISARCV